MTAATQLDLLDLLDGGDQDAPPAMEPPSQPGRVDQTAAGNPVRHGTPAGYTNHRCRCDLCRAWKREDHRRYYEANRDAVAEYQRRYHEANRDAARERKRRRHEANREAVLERQRRWRKANPEKRRAANAARRAREREAHIEHVDYQEIYQRDNWTCQLCGVDLKDRPGEIHVDHIVPLARGGLHYRANLWTTCQTCNLSKGTNLVEPWHIWLAVPPDLDGSLDLDLDLDAAPAAPWADLKDVPAAAIRPLRSITKKGSP